jgi:hypothetical protein
MKRIFSLLFKHTHVQFFIIFISSIECAIYKWKKKTSLFFTASMAIFLWMNSIWFVNLFSSSLALFVVKAKKNYYMLESKWNKKSRRDRLICEVKMYTFNLITCKTWWKYLCSSLKSPEMKIQFLRVKFSNSNLP